MKTGILMAKLNLLGAITANCPHCEGSKSTFNPDDKGKEYGYIPKYDGLIYRLFRCSGCGMGGLGCLKIDNRSNSHLLWFYPEAIDKLNLPEKVPDGIKKEFREGESCIENSALRAASAMFRSVLDKVFRDNGYNTRQNNNLASQIDEASTDGVITKSRKKRAHDDIRVLGNDILHDDWHEIPLVDVLEARKYTHWILTDFYDDRVTVVTILQEKNRLPKKDNKDPIQNGK